MLFFTLSSHAQVSRLALVIGNSDYQNAGFLLNPVNDAADISQALKNTGFEVIGYQNLDLVGMKRAIDDFGLKLLNRDVGLFYYAGHGIQARGVNYLVPVDARINTENDVEYNCVDVGRMLAKMEDAGSRTNIVILDACRDNPFERSWTRSTRGRGLAFMNAPTGSLIAYATSPGTTASDGSGENGLYTSAILKYMYEEDQSILQMFQKVRREVREVSGGTQVPWESTSLEGDFYLLRPGSALPASTAAASQKTSIQETSSPGVEKADPFEVFQPEYQSRLNQGKSSSPAGASGTPNEIPAGITREYLVSQTRNFYGGQPVFFNKHSSSSWTKGTLGRMHKTGYYQVGYKNKNGKSRMEIVSTNNLILAQHKHIPLNSQEIKLNQNIIFFTPFDKVITLGKVVEVGLQEMTVQAELNGEITEFTVPLEAILVLDEPQ
jgi:uncharacterized caspase-like protein